MKICFIVEYYPPHVGGGENLFAGLAEGLAQRGHHCSVVTCSVPGIPLEEERNGVRVHRVKVPPRGDRMWFTFLGLRHALKIARDADIIHTTTYNGAFTAWTVGKILKKPVVITAHEVLGPQWHRLKLPPMSALACRAAEMAVLSLPFDAYACNSRSTQSGLAHYPHSQGKSFFAYPGIDYQRFDPEKQTQASRKQYRKRLGASDSDFVYLCYGRPGMLKGVDYLVDAVPKIHKAIPDSRLVLIMSRQPAKGFDRIQEKIARLPKGSVTLMDSVPGEALPGWIHAADCVVVPSLSEGFGFCCAEACAMEKPVVATTAGSLPEVVGGRHVLAAPGNTNALAQGVIRARQGMLKSRENKKFLQSHFVEQHLLAYSKLLDQASTA